jgi:hypothetical protein
MKGLLYSLRILIAAGSLGGFFGGWALLAHSGKPVASLPPPAQVAPGPLTPQDLLTLPPSQLQPLQPLQPLAPLPSMSFPQLRTGGS